MPGGAPPAPQRFAGLGVPGALQQLQHAGMQGALAGRGGMGGGGPPPFGMPGGPPGGGGVSGLGAAAAAAAAARSSLASSLGMGPGAMGPPGAGGPPRPGLDRTTSAGVLGLGSLPPGAGGAGVPLARAPSAGGMAAARAAGFSPAGARAGPGGPPPPHGLGASAAAGSDLLALINKGVGSHDGGNPMMAGLMGADMGDGGAGAPFDLSDFPHLGTRPGGNGGAGMHGMGGALGALGLSLEGLDLYGKPNHPEFSIQNTEDFPALPGGPAPKGAKQQQGGGADGHYGGMGMGMGMGMNVPPGARDVMHLLGDGASGFGHGGDDGDYGGYGGPQHAMSMAQQQAAAQAAAAARSGAPPRPGSKPGAPPPPPPPATERYGLLGLLSAIRMSDMDLSTLALGTDLTTLGLNLNSTEALHKTFASPWADAPCRPERDLATPAAYLQQPPWLAPGLLGRFSAESLFYVFYSCPGEEGQLLAAEELAARGWLWHKELQAWLQRAPGEPPAAKGERGERGAFIIFDVSTWEAVRKENFALDYAALDETPRPRQQPPQQQQQQPLSQPLS